MSKIALITQDVMHTMYLTAKIAKSSALTKIIEDVI